MPVRLCGKKIIRNADVYKENGTGKHYGVGKSDDLKVERIIVRSTWFGV